MTYKCVSKNIYLLDPEPLGYRKQIALYLVKGSRYSALIDTGPKIVVDNVLELLNNILGEDVKSLKYIILTHVHIDHGGGAATLVKKLRDKYGIHVKIMVHPRGAKHIINPSKLWEASLKVLGKVAEIQGKPDPIDREYVEALNDNSEIDLGDTKILAIYTPGHAPHHISYIIYPDNIAITGDAVAIHYDGRLHPVSPPPFKLNEALQSIEKLKSFKPKRIAVTHYDVVESDGIEVLGYASMKIKQWYKIIKGFVDKGVRDPREILEYILEVDYETKYIVEVRENNPIFKGSALQSVKGILQYILSKS